MTDMVNILWVQPRPPDGSGSRRLSTERESADVGYEVVIQAEEADAAGLTPETFLAVDAASISEALAKEGLDYSVLGLTMELPTFTWPLASTTTWVLEEVETSTAEGASSSHDESLTSIIVIAAAASALTCVLIGCVVRRFCKRRRLERSLLKERNSEFLEIVRNIEEASEEAPGVITIKSPVLDMPNLELLSGTLGKIDEHKVHEGGARSMRRHPDQHSDAASWSDEADASVVAKESEGASSTASEKCLRLTSRAEVQVAKSLTPGTLVRISGLNEKTQFNDMVGTCESWSEHSHTWSVRLRTGATIGVRLENLQDLRDSHSWPTRVDVAPGSSQPPPAVSSTYTIGNLVTLEAVWNNPFGCTESQSVDPYEVVCVSYEYR